MEFQSGRDCFASLAMTAYIASIFRNHSTRDLEGFREAYHSAQAYVGLDIGVRIRISIYMSGNAFAL